MGRRSARRVTCRQSSQSLAGTCIRRKRSASTTSRRNARPTNAIEPLHSGLWTHQKGGCYHDGLFATLRDVIEHYNGFFGTNLSEQQKLDLVEYLKSL